MVFKTKLQNKKSGQKSRIANIIMEEFNQKNIEVVKIVLFGSRAKGTYTKDSDWDFLVVIEKELSFNEKWDIIDKIKRKLVKLKIPNDIIVNSAKNFDSGRNEVGNISFYASREGIAI
jgi:predicted nucleotidyltransferase